MEFSAFLIKGELQNANHFLSLYSYSARVILFPITLFLFRGLTTVDALSL